MQTFTTIILDAALKSTVLLGLAWAVSVTFRNLSASARHSLRLCALGSCLLLPVFSALLPAWHIDVVRNVSAPITTEAPVHGQNFALRPSNTIEHLQAPHVRASKVPTPSVTSRVFSAVPWRLLLLIVWMAGAALFIFRMLAGRARLSMLLRRAVSMDDPAWNAQTKSTAENMGIRRAVALLASRDTDVPLSTGAWKPNVILAQDFEECSPLRRNAVLCHELAHIRRLDTVGLAVAQIGLAVYWFHPLVWMTVRALREDRERACDDYVLASGARPSEYARELLEIADSLRLPDFTAALAMARRSELEGRVMAILNPKLNRGEISWKTTLMAAAITLAIALPMAAMRAQSPSTVPPQKTETSKPAAPAAAASPEGPVAPAIQEEATQADRDEDAADREEATASRSTANARESDERVQAIAKQAAELARLATQMKTGAYATQIAELRAMMAEISLQKGPQQAALADQLAALAELKGETEANPAKLAELRAQLAQLSNLNRLAETQAQQKALADQLAALAALKAVPLVRSGELAQLRAQYATLQAALDGFNPDRRPVFTNECIAGKNVKYNLQKNFDGQRRNQVVTWSGDVCNATLRIDGMVTLDADGGRIEGLSEGGSLEVKEQRGQTVRELRVTSSAEGLKYVLKINGHENPFDEEAKAWLAEFLRAFDQYSANC